MPQIKIINPKPSFVIKAKLQIPYKNYAASTKVFINVLTDPTIPKPDLEFNAVETFSMIMENKWEIPIYNTSNEFKTVLDKKGVTSLYMNCIINDTCMRWCLLNKELLTILMEWCIESIEFQFDDGLMIDRDTITTPKLSYKGDSKDIIDLEIDLDAIQSVNKNFEDDAGHMMVDTNEPEGILELKRLEIASQELEQDEPLIPIDEFLGKLKKGKKPLIEIVDDDDSSKNTLLTSASSKIRQLKPEFSLEKDKEKPTLQIDVTMSKLSPSRTKDNYKLLIKFQSTTSDYDLKFDNKGKELQLTTTNAQYSRTKSLVKLPLPMDIEGDVICFYNESDQILYVYVK